MSETRVGDPEEQHQFDAALAALRTGSSAEKVVARDYLANDEVQAFLAGGGVAPSPRGASPPAQSPQTLPNVPAAAV